MEGGLLHLTPSSPRRVTHISAATQRVQASQHRHPFLLAAPPCLPLELGWAKLSAEKREREGGAGSVQTSLPAWWGEEKALGTAAMLSSYVKTQPPNLESGSVSKYRHELKNSPQNETSPSPWFKVSCIKTNLPDDCICTQKVLVLGGRPLFLEE